MGTDVLLAAFVVMLCSLTGVIFIQKSIQKFVLSKLSFLVSFSAGVFLVTATAISHEVFASGTAIWLGVSLMLLGYGLAWFLHKLLPETHHHHGHDCDRTHQAARKLIVGDIVHNIADGVVLMVAFSASTALGVAATLSIVIHEVLQEVSEFFVLCQAGYSVKKALLINFLVSTSIFVGLILGYFALAATQVEIALLAISAGFFFNVVIHDMLPKRSDHESNKPFLKHIMLVALGVLLMTLISSFLAESH